MDPVDLFNGKVIAGGEFFVSLVVECFYFPVRQIKMLL